MGVTKAKNIGLISGWRFDFGCIRRLVRMRAEDLGVEVVERVVYSMRRPNKGDLW